MNRLNRILVLLFLGLALWTPFGVARGQSPATDNSEVERFIFDARAYMNQDKIVQAIRALESAKKLAEDNEDNQALINTHNMFARVYLRKGDLAKAEYHFDQARFMLEDTAYRKGQAWNLLIEAEKAIEVDSTGFAYGALDNVKAAKKTNNNRNLLNRAALLEGRIFELIDRPDSAIVRYNALREENGDPYEKDYLRTAAHLSLAMLYASREEVENAISNAENARELSKNNEFSREYLRANELLSELYAENGQYRDAYNAIQNLTAWRDSAAAANLGTEDEAVEDVFIQQAADRAKEYEEEIAELSESASRSEITAILTSGFLTIISLLAVSLYRNNQIKLKTNDLLQTKNRELQTARDAAVQAMEAKTNFLSTVSHELRTPLYAVTGLTHLLLEENPRKNQLEHLKALKFSGDYLLNFINDILQINKIDAEKLEPLEVECNLKKVLADVLQGLQQSARDHRNELILDYDPQIPSHLLSDPVKLSQVFMNLVGNALKFTRDGEVLVIAKLLEREGEYARLYFEVRDNGIGIEKERQKNIFDSFEQGSIQINREYGGTGLGLTIVKSLLGLFGSTIQLESEPGKGSSFFFELRMKCREQIEEAEPFEIAPQDYQYKGLHLLLVEDNKINQVITRKMLAKKEITCDIASNGTEAVELAGENTYDGILMDIHMPGISGVEATIEIRKFDPETPIIALTAISLDDSLEEFYAAGCNDVVTKPFKPEVFYERIGENIVEPKMRKSIS